MSRLSIVLAFLVCACNQAAVTSKPESEISKEAGRQLAPWGFRPVVAIKDDPVWGKTFMISYLANGSANPTLTVKLNGTQVYTETIPNVDTGVSGWKVAATLTPGAVYDYTLTHGDYSFTSWVRIPDRSKSWFDMKFAGDAQNH